MPSESPWSRPAGGVFALPLPVLSQAPPTYRQRVVTGDLAGPARIARLKSTILALQRGQTVC
jgi:hypothetical protein